MSQRNSYNRTDRLRKAIIREFSDILMRELKESRLKDLLISVTDVEVSGDMRHARIFISVMGEPELQNSTISILQEHLPRIRSILGQRIRLRYMPDLDIRLDTSLERGARVTHLLNQISRGEV